ncbi:DUF2795 domain-containing protein [Methanosarcina sp. MSH10X1]|uniref:DUF2795 domain-containing protein n=1 Tax=Methanosarcina sp. MSH10X1 TaxID=2507075 RepID=UPI001F0C9749|nr:DUF2795 domain-containing protein [Methanosarcina sp. MSH10X1]
MHTSPIEVQKALKDMDYPANKEQLIQHAKKHKASNEVLEDLQDIPEKEYTNAADVSKEFKGDKGRSGREEGEGISHRGAGSPPIETQKALKGMDYPAGKKEIIKKARDNKAPKEVIEILEDIPDREYENAADVSKEFRGETGHIEER